MKLSDRLKNEGYTLYELRPVKGYVRTEIESVDSEDDLFSGGYALKNEEEITDDFKEMKNPDIRYILSDSMGRQSEITPDNLHKYRLFL